MDFMSRVRGRLYADARAGDAGFVWVGHGNRSDERTGCAGDNHADAARDQYRPTRHIDPSGNRDARPYGHRNSYVYTHLGGKPD
jgi:hypothetical protein